MTNTYLDKLKHSIEAVRNDIVAHPLYSHIHTIQDVQLFTQYHVYAVWDFMSLLKGLQQQLTCVQYPWLPVGNANTRYLINEIVAGEESDIDEQGNRCSHFELYCRAMQQMGATTEAIEQLLVLLQQGISVQDALNKLSVPPAVKQFVGFTFDILQQGDAAVMAAVFTFGREDLIPDMFIHLVKDLEQKFPGQLEVFRYYLERHIEVDGDHHSHLAMEMVQELCGNNEETWTKATAAAVQALKMRNLLWSGALEAIMAQQKISINK